MVPVIFVQLSTNVDTDGTDLIIHWLHDNEVIKTEEKLMVRVKGFTYDFQVHAFWQ